MVKGLLASAALAAALAVAGTVAAQADVVIYQAPQDNSNLYANNQIGFVGNPGVNGGGAYGVGNTITFAHSGYKLTTVDLFGYAGGSSTAPFPSVTVDLYSGSNPNTGTLLGSASVDATGNGWTTEVLDFNGVAIPQTVTFIVSLSPNGGSYDDAFVNWQQFTGVSGSPTAGTSGDMWYGTGPSSYIVDNNFAVDTGAQTNTLAVQFNAMTAPEPATWAMMGLGFAALGFAGFRKSHSARAIAA